MSNSSEDEEEEFSYDDDDVVISSVDEEEILLESDDETVEEEVIVEEEEDEAEMEEEIDDLDYFDVSYDEEEVDQEQQVEPEQELLPQQENEDEPGEEGEVSRSEDGWGEGWVPNSEQVTTSSPQEQLKQWESAPEKAPTQAESPHRDGARQTHQIDDDHHHNQDNNNHHKKDRRGDQKDKKHHRHEHKDHRGKEVDSRNKKEVLHEAKHQKKDNHNRDTRDARNKQSSHQEEKKKKTRKRRRKGREEPPAYHVKQIDLDYVRVQNEKYFREVERVKARQEALTKARQEALQVEREYFSTTASNDTFLNNNASIATVDFRNDPVEEMTRGRRIALSLMGNSWYNPLAKQKTVDTTGRHEKPDLATAWAYFEHVALDRYIVEDDDEGPQRGCCAYLRQLCCSFSQPQQLQRADPGTTAKKTRLYDPILTPHSQLGDFGLGIGLYFSTVRAVAVICLVAGVINISSMIYFASDNYVGEENRKDVAALLRSSAICTDTSWVPCPDCDCRYTLGNDRLRWEQDRCVTINSTNVEDDKLTFALKNNCDAAVWAVAAVNYFSIIFILIAIIGLGWYLKHAEIAFDEDQQTASDYSIIIKNPPPDATDPEEWKDYFRDGFDGAKVAVCTVALDNDLLVQALVDRRQTYRQIRYGLPPGSSMDVIDIAFEAAEIERKRSFWGKLVAWVLPGVPEHFGHLVVVNAKITALVQLEYVATHVFVSFETEADQRHVLEKLSVGSLRAKRNEKSALSDKIYLFRGAHVLDVREASEPNTIHWQSLNVSNLRKYIQQAATTLLTFGGIVAVTFIVRAINDLDNEYSSLLAAVAISCFNAGFPEVAKIVVLLESHADEGSKQSSLYFKIALFRWVITAIVITLITPFTSTLDLNNGLIPQIYAIFFSEIITINAIQLLDAYGHFKRHLLAPRAKNQDAMNILFRGEEVELAERYTNVTKIFFLALWYSSIYPAAFFMAAFTLFVNYFTDRFGILRTWKRAAHLGSEVSALSRRYFFPFANMAMVFISSFYWAGFPFDNLCDSGDRLDVGSKSYIGNFTIHPDPTQRSEEINFTVSEGDSIYNFCSQDLLLSNFSFPFIPSQQEGRGGDWMTQSQEQITTIFGWSSLGVMGVGLFRIILSLFRGYWANLRGDYSPTGADQKINFSEVPAISSYIPQVQNYLFAYPLIVCDSDLFESSLFDWEDPDRLHAFYDLTKDADALMESKEYDKSKCFSKVRHWIHNREESDSDE